MLDNAGERSYLGFVRHRSSAFGHRLAAALLLTAVFALPFHFHFFSPTAQLSQECTCYHGVKTQTGPAPAATDWKPAVAAWLVHSFRPRLVTRIAIDSRSIRAPPSL